MNTKFAKALLRTLLAASIVGVSGAAVATVTTVNLTAQRMSAVMPDGATVPMWGYCTTGSCTARWAPGPTIVVPYESGTAAANSLTINLTNRLPVPTSLVVLGQLGGGLGTPTKMDGPEHATQKSTTWPGNGTPDVEFTPPSQGQRVMSFATEVPAFATSTATPATTSLTWSNLKPGTYIYETGTLPSIQAPMGLYGVLIVTQAPVLPASSANTFVPGKAYPSRSNEALYDSDVSLLFSEIDPVQNAAVDVAALAGTNVTKRFDDTTCVPKCYPAAVNYTPTYFLINGQAYDKTAPNLSAFAVAGTNTAPGSHSTKGQLLVRLLNAGLRTHVPSIVGLPMAIVAEDGNVAPGNPKQQNEVLLTAGKTHDVLVTPPSTTGSSAKPSAYRSSIFPLFDRQLSLTSGNQTDGGMQGFLQVASSGASSGSGALPLAIAPKATADNFYMPINSTNVNIGNVLSNDIGIRNPVSTNLPAALRLDATTGNLFALDALTTTLNFKYCGNDATAAAVCATVTVNVTGQNGPAALSDSYTSRTAKTFRQIAAGVLSNDTDPNGLKLQVDPTSVTPGTCNAAVKSDGSFVATQPSGGATSCTFSYKVKNTAGTVSGNAATVTVNFPAAGSGMAVAVKDAQGGPDVTDYRWIIQEDLTFKVDPAKTPSLTERTLGTSFHRSHMPVVASGCVGPVSCRDGQTVRGSSVSLEAESLPGDVALNANKRYYISILPGDAIDGGHMMGGAEFKPTQSTVVVQVQPNGLDPAQLSIYIYEDNAPINNQMDGGEVGLGGFNIILMDAVGRSGDVAGQQSYDQFGMPLSNALLGRAGCPDELNKVTNGAGNPNNSAVNGNIVGMVYTCPNAPDRGPVPVRSDFNSQARFQRALNAYNQQLANDAIDYALAGHALIKNVTPARYDVIAHPAAARQGKGEVWWQVETLEGTAAQDAFTGIKEPRYFQEFGPPGFHTSIGFVNPDRVKKYAIDNGLTGVHKITGNITNQHMSRPSDVTLHDSGSYDLLSSTTCQVGLNSSAGDGPAIAITQCDHDGNFVLSGIPSGDYEIVIWDQWLDQIIQSQAVTVPTSTAPQTVALGAIPVLSWFTQYDQNIFMDANKNGVYDPGEKGISNVTMTTRYRDGGISNQTATDSNGNGLLAELFPLFNWYVTEADTTRFKQTGVSVSVDAGGPVLNDPLGAGIWNSTYKDCVFDPANPLALEPCSSFRVEKPGANSYGLQGFISQRNTINWGRAPYVAGENGGIQGVVVYSTTRPFDDQRYNVQTLWEPLVPNVKVNLYRKTKAADGTETLTLVDTTTTTSFDAFVNELDATGKQKNIQCLGQDPKDPFFKYTLNSTDQFRCYDGWHNWNQVQAAPYDGRYQFPSAAYIAANALTTAQTTAGQTLVSLPAGQYVVEAITPPGYEIVKEEDKNIFTGDSYNAPSVQQFGGLGNIFILPDQATLNNANPYNPRNSDGIQSNATSNLGVTSSQMQFAECVGSLHRVPDYLSLYPQSALVAPFAGMDRPLCDRKLVNLGDQMQTSATFFVYTEVPAAAAGTGIILDDATSEFNAAAPDFGEKASVPFVPVSIKDFNGREMGRVYSDQWGAYNVMTPSSWSVNPPTPSGYTPNMLVTCMNDPGPIPDPAGTTDPVTGKVRMIIDPQYNPAYSNFCYTLPFMPGRTTYLDTPVLPIAAFAAGYNPVDCEYPDATPAILRVDSDAATFGPYVPVANDTTLLTIKALGDVSIPNPAYAGPFALSGLASQRTIKRHYGFGTAIGKVTVHDTLSGTDKPLNIKTWSDGQITATVPAGVTTGELVITAENGRSSVDAVTLTIGGKAPTYVAGPDPAGTLPGAIQRAIDAASPGDLIMVAPGTYSELVVMWKPVRLQGVGAASVVINAAKYPTQKLEVWRPLINGLFSVDADTGLSTTTATRVAQVDPLPTQTITGGSVLLEPTVLGTEEGAGITVLAKDPAAAPCDSNALSTFGDNKAADSNFSCNRSRIDGISVTGGDAGGGIFVNGWAHGLEISNNRIYGNAGAYNGGVRIGVPYLQLEALPANAAGFGYDNNVSIHHNAVTKNGTVEGPAAGGGAGGGVSICTGTDGYSVDHNWVCGNISSSDGGGIGHIGLSQNGKITNNTVLFNQSFQQTGSTHGGGIVVTGEPPLAGTLSLGTGSVTISANLVRGNFAEGGHGGGIRLQQVNGADVQAAAGDTTTWHKVTVTNNMVVDNIAGFSGGGISLADAVLSKVDNNTVAANDSVGIAGVVLAGGAQLPGETPGTPGRGKPSPAGISTETTSQALRNASALVGPISSPELTNNIVWQNRSFFYSGDGRLCAGNSLADVALDCVVLADQTSTGEKVSGAKYWDLGVVGDASPKPGVNKLSPYYTVLGNASDYPTSLQSSAVSTLVTTTRNVGVAFAVGGTATIITTAPHGFTLGQSVTIAGVTGTAFFSPGALNGTFVISNVVDTNTFQYDLLGAHRGVNGTASVTTTTTITNIQTVAAHNTATDPQLVDVYFNGSRVMPELDAVINPPSVKNLQVAATVDEGNNYVNLRYGPLYLTKPGETAVFGDYHLKPTSPALDAGTTVAGIAKDIDGDTRPSGAAFDIGADELVPPTADLRISKTDGVTSVQPGDAVTYTITVSNFGPQAVNAATVTDIMPAALTGVTWTCSASSGSSCPASGNGNIGAAVSLLNGGNATFIVNATVSPSATGTLANTATVAAPAGVVDPIGANNTATDTDTIVLPTADLSITKTDGVSNVVPGGQLTYTIVVGNGAGGNQSNRQVTTTVTDTAPAGFTGLSWSCSASAGSSCPANGTGNVSASVTLAPQGTATFKVSGTVSSVTSVDGIGRVGSVLTNTASVAAVAGLVDPATNNTASDTDTVALLDDFNRGNAVGLGTSWNVSTTFFAAPTIVIANQAITGLVAGNAYWNGNGGSGFGSKQAAAFTFANNTLNNAALILKATGTTNANGVLPSFIRVLYNSGNITVATTTTNGGSYTLAPGGPLVASFTNGDTLTALVDSEGAVNVWKTTVAGLTTLIGTRTPTATPTANALWTTGGGRIGMQLPTGARVDNFSGGTMP
jgi:uncharacterized repeat protein (TIGR01451 family)